ncbi:2'-5' RNA ligase family protein [Streptomyces sp. NPDC058672]|uniref:2'-5' RNA ligase family protein n=1 Tax=Streptomyces sp. NPDC058672 TaxID=3346591 RepID=UPI003650A822
MKEWTPFFRSRPWRHAMQARHVYALPESTDHELLALAAACRSAMSSYPIDPQPDDLLHITIAMDSSMPSDQMSQQDTEDFVSALEQRLVDIPAFTVTCGPPIANGAGVLLDAFPSEEFDELQARVHKTLLDARGPSSVQYEPGRPHASLGYSFDSADSDPLQSALRKIMPRHAPWTVSRVHVLDVAYHRVEAGSSQMAWRMSWESVAEVPLLPMQRGDVAPASAEST